MFILQSWEPSWRPRILVELLLFVDFVILLNQNFGPFVRLGICNIIFEIPEAILPIALLFCDQWFQLLHLLLITFIRIFLILSKPRFISFVWHSLVLIFWRLSFRVHCRIVTVCRSCTWGRSRVLWCHGVSFVELRDWLLMMRVTTEHHLLTSFLELRSRQVDV